MKIILTLVVAALGFFGLITYNFETPIPARGETKLPANQQAENFPAKEKTPVLVELFTSEGCISCPPADENLSFLDKRQPNADAEIITLSMHVDYWNRLGWTDRFSSPLFSQRQAIYGQKFHLSAIYTPQMIVDGAFQFVGSNVDEANKAINEALKSQKSKIELSVSGEKLRVEISGADARENATVFLAIAENNLSSDVKQGENSGRKLEHNSVVRRLQPLGRISPPDQDFNIETALEIQPDWKRDNLKFIVFLQENQSRKILGVNRVGL